MACNSFSLHAHGSARKAPSVLPCMARRSSSPSSTFTPFSKKKLQQVRLRADVHKAVKNAWLRLLDAFVDSTFQFIDQPTLPSQSNFRPVGEIGEAVVVTSIEGEIPADFPEGTYIRNGSNPMFGALQSVVSPLGRSSNIWVEGEGMLHALHFSRDFAMAAPNCAITYKNRYVESDTFMLEKARNRPCFLPAVQGDSLAVLAAFLFNLLRFGKALKCMSNTSVFEHSGRCFSVSENYIPQEIDMYTLATLGDWDIRAEWNRPFTAHPKKAPGTGELVTIGVDGKKPFIVLGVISADGKKLTHKVDLKFERSIVSHDVGVTEKYNIVMDMPLTIDVLRLLKGQQLIKYEKESYARIGVMPRYGEEDTIKWFQVEPHYTFHLVNSYEDGDEVVVRGCRALASMIPGPDPHELESRGIEEECARDTIDNESLITRVYEWRLNMKTGGVKEGNLTGMDLCLDFPMINDEFTGLQNKFAYAKALDFVASSPCGLPKFGSLVKCYFAEQNDQISELKKMEHHQLGENQFCSGATFVPKPGGAEEDDGWIITYVHNEGTNVSQVHIIDAKRFESEPVAKITLPQRVPYGFHGTFITNLQSKTSTLEKEKFQ